MEDGGEERRRGVDGLCSSGRGSNDAFEEDYRTMVVMIAVSYGSKMCLRLWMVDVGGWRMRVVTRFAASVQSVISAWSVCVGRVRSAGVEGREV
jgi:hypothetical protein